MEYAKKIRPLTYKDFKRVKGLITNYIDQSGETSIKGLISAAKSAKDEDAENSDGAVVAAFLAVFKKVLTYLDEEVHAWFCDLLGVTSEEYEDLPVDMDVQVLNQIKEAPGVGNFFTGVSLLFSGTTWYQKALSKLKEKYGSLITSLVTDSKD